MKSHGFLYHDGRADEYLELAAKAMSEGKYEKAMAYAQMSAAHTFRTDSIRSERKFWTDVA